MCWEMFFSPTCLEYQRHHAPGIRLCVMCVLCVSMSAWILIIMDLANERDVEAGRNERTCSRGQILRRERGQGKFDLFCFRSKILAFSFSVYYLKKTLNAVSSMMSGRDPPLYCTLTLIAIHTRPPNTTKTKYQKV